MDFFLVFQQQVMVISSLRIGIFSTPDTDIKGTAIFRQYLDMMAFRVAFVVLYGR